MRRICGVFAALSVCVSACGASGSQPAATDGGVAAEAGAGAQGDGGCGASATCAACSQSSCVAAESACAAQSDCQAALCCISGCLNTSQCKADCAQHHPNGYGDANTLLNCRAQSCSPSCG